MSRERGREGGKMRDIRRQIYFRRGRRCKMIMRSDEKKKEHDLIHVIGGMSKPERRAQSYPHPQRIHVCAGQSFALWRI